MAQGIARRLAHGSLIPLAAFGVLALGACDTADVTAPSPTATAGGSAPATSGGKGTLGDSGTANGNSGAAQILPDGAHNGYLSVVNTAKRTVTFDKVELLSGEAARKAYLKKNPGETDGPPNDYFLVNDNKLLRTLPVTDDVTVAVIDSATGDSAATAPSSWAKLPAFLADKDNSTLFKLTVKGDKITAMESIYLP